MTWYTLRCDAIDAFKRSWPCHGLPDDLHSLSAEFASNGDLVDLEAYDESGKRLDTHDFDGPALLTLVSDARKLGDTSN
jgi:hypothetical protein